jgi:hypothetical protein
MEESFSEYLNHVFTKEEIAERVAFIDDWFERAAQIEKESPLPDDIMDIVDPPRGDAAARR